ncbi:MAG: peroxidase family protein, partial [Tabrizicola sp.]
MPPILSTHDMLDRTVAHARPARVTSKSKYCYRFPALAADDQVGCFAGTTPQQTWERLQAFEVATRVPFSDVPVLQMRLPAAYTYFGQFVNHDISAPRGDVMSHGADAPPAGVVGAVDPPGLDRSRRASVEIILRNFFNDHPEPLTLASLYGEGPGSADPNVRALYAADGKRFRLGKTRREVDKVFVDDMKDPALVDHATGAPDLLRTGGGPLIADLRNDENLIISQLHLALLLFHNKVVAALEPSFPDPATCFAEARKVVTRHYHWLILNDYLPQLLSRAVQARPLAEYPSNLQKPNEVPLEFTTAAFRFGHSMVGSAYDFNANFGVGGHLAPEGATLAHLFAFTSHQNMGQNAPGLPELPDHWVIDWERMTRFQAGTAGAPPRPFGNAERIDLSFAPDMLNVVGDSEIAVHGSILFRNLMRGFHRRMPFGQQLADQYGVDRLSEAEVRRALPREKALAPGMKSLRQVAEDLGMLAETPAWLYFLCESRVREAGERVGPTASHLIADTIVGLIRHNGKSLLNTAPDWHPRNSPVTT